jgi:adenosine deaminase
MLEVCPTSNDLLQVVERVDDHPLPALLDAGLRVCLNTDDPGWFDTDLVTELELATERLGVSFEQHRTMQLDASAASFMTPPLRASVEGEIAGFRPAR